MDIFSSVTSAIEKAFTMKSEWREYDLIKYLKDSNDPELPNMEPNQALSLFKTHFLTRHALYSLKSKWAKNKSAHLEIGIINIQKFPYITHNETSVSNSDLLGTYYLDQDNYFDMTKEEISLLLNGFWQRINNPDQSEEAYQALGLEIGASYADIKRAFKKKAQTMHPDKGGDEQKFKELSKAKDELLRRTTL